MTEILMKIKRSEYLAMKYKIQELEEENKALKKAKNKAVAETATTNKKKEAK